MLTEGAEPSRKADTGTWSVAGPETTNTTMTAVEEIIEGKARPASAAGASRGHRPGPLGIAFRFATFAVCLAAALALGGFVVFAEHVRSAVPDANISADGIVALTGGAQRIDEAIALLGLGAAERLLVSGVHERTSRDSFAAANPLAAPLLACCVDLGREARDTRGNAAEARDWAKRHGLSSLIVVTSAYHMPRSLAEFAEDMPDVALLPYPVQHVSLRLDTWMTDAQVFRLLFVEYLKYLVVRLT